MAQRILTYDFPFEVSGFSGLSIEVWLFLITFVTSPKPQDKKTRLRQYHFFHFHIAFPGLSFPPFPARLFHRRCRYSADEAVFLSIS